MSSLEQLTTSPKTTVGTTTGSSGATLSAGSGNSGNGPDPFSPREHSGHSSQVDTFKNWLNYWLRLGGNEGIEDLRRDFEDGIKLIQLVEALTGEKVKKKPNVPAKLNPQKLDNINIALDHLRATFLSQLGVSDTGWVLPSANNIFEGDYKLILGFIWILIQYTFQLRSKNIQSEAGTAGAGAGGAERHQGRGDSTRDGEKEREGGREIQREERIREREGRGGKSTKDNCVHWLKKYLVDYSPSLSSFPACMRDGRIFCFLIHKQDPKLIDLAEVERMTPGERMKEAFALAEKNFGIPALLTPEGVIHSVDEMSVLTYLSTWIAHIEYAAAKRREEEGGKGKGGKEKEKEREKERERERGMLANCLYTWVNVRIQSTGEKLQNPADLANTNVLFNLTELLTRKKIETATPSASLSPADRLELSLNHLKKVGGVRIPVDSTKILAGDEASSLALIYSIFTKFKTRTPTPAPTPASSSTPAPPTPAPVTVSDSLDDEPLVTWFRSHVDMKLGSFPGCLANGTALHHFISKKSSTAATPSASHSTLSLPPPAANGENFVERVTLVTEEAKKLGVPPIISPEDLVKGDTSHRDELLMYLKFLRLYL